MLKVILLNASVFGEHQIIVSCCLQRTNIRWEQSQLVTIS